MTIRSFLNTVSSAFSKLFLNMSSYRLRKKNPTLVETPGAKVSELSNQISSITDFDDQLEQILQNDRAQVNQLFSGLNDQIAQLTSKIDAINATSPLPVSDDTANLASVVSGHLQAMQSMISEAQSLVPSLNSGSIAPATDATIVGAGTTDATTAIAPDATISTEDATKDPGKNIATNAITSDSTSNPSVVAAQGDPTSNSSVSA